jgi:Domain of unknown function (DUF4389)
MQYEVAYRDRLSRWKTLLRLPLLVPVVIFDAFLQYLLWTALFIGWITVFCRKKYPGWLFAAATGALAFQARYHAYGQLITDQFPSFDREKSPVFLRWEQPADGSLSRWRVYFFKLCLIAPHIVLLTFLGAAVVVVTFLAWFAILFTGRYPRGLFGFVTGVNRWWYRIVGYFASFTDAIPPYALSQSAGPARGTSAVVSGVIGVALVGGFVSFMTAAIILANQATTRTVDYTALEAGRPGAGASLVFGAGTEVQFRLSLVGAEDPAEGLANIFEVPSGFRVIVFEAEVTNFTASSESIARSFASLQFEGPAGKRTTSAAATLVNGLPAPANVPRRGSATIRIAFVLPEGATPLKLTLRPGWVTQRVEFRFD